MESKRVVVTSDRKGKGSLTVTRIEQEEEGMYKCVATNEHGSTTSCTKVSIVGEHLTGINLRSFLLCYVSRGIGEVCSVMRINC